MRTIKSALLSLCAVALLALPSAAAPVTDTANATVTTEGGTPSVSFTSGLTWGTVTLTGSAITDQASTANLVFDVNDNTGDGGGWTLGISGTDFTGPTAGDGLAHTIPIGNLSVGGSAATFNSANGGYTAPTTLTDVTLTSTAQTMITAGAGEGVGLQTVTIPASNVTLDIPYNAKAGSYSSTITFELTDTNL